MRVAALPPNGEADKEASSLLEFWQWQGTNLDRTGQLSTSLL